MFNFFKKKKFALFCTDTYIQILILYGNGRNIKVEGYGQRNLPSGVIKNGKIEQEKQLAVEIITLLSELNIKDKNCFVALPKNIVFEHIFYLETSLKKEKFVSRLEEEIKKIIPINFDRLKYVYHKTNYGKIQTVYVVGVENEIVTKYDNVLRSFCNLNPILFESETTSLIRNIPINLDEDKGKIILNLLPNKIEWFLLWKQDIFDSNTIKKFGDKDNIKEAINDMSLSIRNFSTTTKRTVSNIYIIGDQEKVADILKMTEQNLNIKTEYVSNFKIELKNFEIPAGLALYEKNKNYLINLLEKSPKRQLL